MRVRGSWIALNASCQLFAYCKRALFVQALVKEAQICAHFQPSPHIIRLLGACLGAPGNRPIPALNALAAVKDSRRHAPSPSQQQRGVAEGVEATASAHPEITPASSTSAGRPDERVQAASAACAADSDAARVTPAALPARRPTMSAIRERALQQAYEAHRGGVAMEGASDVPAQVRRASAVPAVLAPLHTANPKTLWERL
jgi:hypothetical protein